MIDIAYDLEKYGDFVVGYKARMSSSVTINSGVEALKIFRKLSKKSSLPLMVHIGNEPPTFSEIVNYLKSGDVITHALNFKNHSLFDKNYFPKKSLIKAKENNVYFDLGHGSESFNYLGGKKALANGFKLDLISSDIYRINQKNGIVSSLALTISKMHTLGIS
jgi:dihydroorotase